jgi:hypothetical protein
MGYLLLTKKRYQIEVYEMKVTFVLVLVSIQY